MCPKALATSILSGCFLHAVISSTAARECNILNQNAGGTQQERRIGMARGHTANPPSRASAES